jgi:hypothetical protein
MVFNGLLLLSHDFSDNVIHEIVKQLIEINFAQFSGNYFNSQ